MKSGLGEERVCVSTAHVGSAGGVVMAVRSDYCRHIFINATGLRL